MLLIIFIPVLLIVASVALWVIARDDNDMENQLPDVPPRVREKDREEEPIYTRIGNICQSRIKEASGITYHPQRESLFIVGDEGNLYEMSTDGKPIKSRNLKKSNMEGITVNPLTGLLYAVIEGDDDIIEIDPEAARVIRKFELDRDFDGRKLLKKGGRGLEAIVFVPDPGHREGGTFWIGNQSFDQKKGKELSVICEVALPLKSLEKKNAKGKIVGFFSPDITDISGMTYDPRNDRLVVISDANNMLLEMTRNGEIVRQQEIPGHDQEGIMLDEMGFMYIAQENGEIIKFAGR